MEKLALGLAILAIVALLVWDFVRSRGIHLQVDTPTPSEQVRAAVVSVMGRKRRWLLTSDGGSTMSYQFRRKPNVLVAFVLLWFFIIPGIIYLVVGGKDETLTASTFDSGTDTITCRVQIVANGPEGRSLAKKVRSQLIAV